MQGHDFELVGSVSDSVTVQAGAPLVNTASAVVSTAVDQTFVENIPLNGRGFQTLILTDPRSRLSSVCVGRLWQSTHYI